MRIAIAVFEKTGRRALDKLKGQQRSYLSKQAQELKPVVYIGKNGLREGVIASLDKALSDHE
ncbi:MAG: YhbY family RNA-binding protein, partial [Spirochaetaceae bacterium]|nr:YhbY family RNA-binding protein [Spirochaetaceae bacterium]